MRKEPVVSKNNTRFVGLDVHGETIAVAVADPGGEVRSVGTIPNRPEAVRLAAERAGGRKLPPLRKGHARVRWTDPCPREHCVFAEGAAVWKSAANWRTSCRHLA